MISYVDTSAWVKLLSVEAHSDQFRGWVGDRLDGGHLLVSSEIMHAELGRAAVRVGIPLLEINNAISLLSLIPVTGALLRRAGSRVFPSGPKDTPRWVRTLDAIHIESALMCGVDELLTYDVAMAEAAEALGIPAISPGLPRNGEP